MPTPSPTDADPTANSRRVQQQCADLEREVQELQARIAQAEQARRAAEAESLSLRQWLADVNRELRTPLTSILGYVGLLLRNEAHDAQRTAYLEIIRRNGEYLHGVLDALPGTPPAQARPPQEPTLRLEGRVLLAEDSRDTQHLIRVLLQRVGLEVDVAADGREAGQRVAAAQEAGRPYDVILMDMQMPELDGYAATRQLRSQGFAQPIIALTAHAMPGDREKCLAAGCNAYLAKPVDRNALLAAIARYRLPVSAPPAPEPHLPAPAAPAVRGPGLLDDPRIGDADRARILNGFVQQLQQRVPQIESAWKEQDRGGLLRVVHALHGSAGLFGFMPLADAARGVEHRLHEGSEPSVIGEAVRRLLEACRQVIDRDGVSIPAAGVRGVSAIGPETTQGADAP